MIHLAVFVLLAIYLAHTVLAESRYSPTVTIRKTQFGSARRFTQQLRVENIPYMFEIEQLQDILQPGLQHHVFASHYANHEVQIFHPTQATRIDNYGNLTRSLLSSIDGANLAYSFNNQLLLPSVSGLASEIDAHVTGLFAPLSNFQTKVDFWFGVKTSQFPRVVHFGSRRFLMSPTQSWRLHLCSWAKYQQATARCPEPTLVRCQDEWIMNRQASIYDRMPMTPFTIPKGVFVYIPAGYWYQVELLDASSLDMILQLDYQTTWSYVLAQTTDWLLWQGGGEDSSRSGFAVPPDEDSSR